MQSSDSTQEVTVYVFMRPLKDWTALGQINVQARHAGLLIDDPTHGLMRIEIIPNAAYKALKITSVEKFRRQTVSQHGIWLYEVGKTVLSYDEFIPVITGWLRENPDYNPFIDNCRTFADAVVKRLILKNGILNEEFAKHTTRDSIKNHGVCRAVERCIQEYGFNTEAYTGSAHTSLMSRPDSQAPLGISQLAAYPVHQGHRLQHQDQGLPLWGQHDLRVPLVRLSDPDLPVTFADFRPWLYFLGDPFLKYVKHPDAVAPIEKFPLSVVKAGNFTEEPEAGSHMHNFSSDELLESTTSSEIDSMKIESSAKIEKIPRISGIGISRPPRPPKLRSVGELSFYLRPISDGVQAGIQFRSNASGGNVSFGFEARNLSQTITNGINIFFGEVAESGDVVSRGERFRYKIKATDTLFSWGRITGKSFKVEICHKKGEFYSGCEKTIYYKSEKNAQAALNEGLQEILEDVCKVHKNLFIKDYEKALEAKEFSSAKNIYDHFFSKYEGLPESESYRATAEESMWSHIHNYISTCSEERLKVLCTQPEYQGHIVTINQCLDNFVIQKILKDIGVSDFENAKASCAEIIDPEARLACKRAIDLDQAEFLYFVANHQVATALTPADLEAAEQAYKGTLKLDPNHQEALQELAQCYFHQGKLREMRAHLSVGFLAQDPKNAFAREQMARSYEYEISDREMVYSIERKTLQEDAEKAKNDLMPDAAEKLDGLLRMDREHLDAQKVLLEEWGKYGDDRSAPKTASEKQTLAQIELNTKYRKALPAQEKRFNGQSAQIALDFSFLMTGKLIACFSDSKNLQQSWRACNLVINNLLQLHVHYKSLEVEGIMRDCPDSSLGLTLGWAQYALLATQMLQDTCEGVTPWLPQDLAKKIKEYSDVLKQGVFPCAQVTLSFLNILHNSDRLLEGLFAFHPEALLGIESLKKYFLTPNPEDRSAYLRFALGKTFEKLAQDDFFKKTTHAAGYLACFQQTLSIWIRRMTSDYVPGLPGVGQAYIVMRALHLISAGYATYNHLEQEWSEYRLKKRYQDAIKLREAKDMSGVLQICNEILTEARYSVDHPSTDIKTLLAYVNLERCLLQEHYVIAPILDDFAKDFLRLHQDLDQVAIQALEKKFQCPIVVYGSSMKADFTLPGEVIYLWKDNHAHNHKLILLPGDPRFLKSAQDRINKSQAEITRLDSENEILQRAITKKIEQLPVVQNALTWRESGMRSETSMTMEALEDENAQLRTEIEDLLKCFEKRNPLLFSTMSRFPPLSAASPESSNN